MKTYTYVHVVFALFIISADIYKCTNKDGFLVCWGPWKSCCCGEYWLFSDWSNYTTV